MSRIKVAGVVERLPQGSLQDTPRNDPPARTKRLGRPPKPPGTKAVGVTVMLWPAEIEKLEQLRAAVNEGLPAEVMRSDMARLAFALLLDLKPGQVRKALAERRGR